MRITEITKAKGSRYTVYVDGAYWYILDAEIIYDNGLKTGLVVEEDFLEEVRRQADLRKAKERALYLLSYRDHSRQELMEKLERNYDPAIAEEITDKMESLGLVDDWRYGQKLARDLLERKHLGQRRARYEMGRKGLSREMTDQILAEFDADPSKQIEELIEKKYKRYLTDEKGIIKVKNALARLGHSFGDINVAIAAYLESMEAEEAEDPWQSE